jgi:2-C-methyl-D-erythritol 4-phosphate cytidylyltransferase
LEITDCIRASDRYRVCLEIGENVQAHRCKLALLREGDQTCQLLADACATAVCEYLEELSAHAPRHRNKLVVGPTGLLQKAYARVQGTPTDDAQVIEAMGLPVYCVEGSESNIKITTKEDLRVAEGFLRVPQRSKDNPFF